MELWITFEMFNYLFTIDYRNICHSLYFYSSRQKRNPPFPDCMHMYTFKYVEIVMPDQNSTYFDIFRIDPTSLFRCIYCGCKAGIFDKSGNENDKCFRNIRGGFFRRAWYSRKCYEVSLRTKLVHCSTCEKSRQRWEYASWPRFTFIS